MEFDIHDMKSFLTSEKYDDVNAILEIDAIKSALEVEGAFIAGGFARTLLTDKTVEEYLWPQNYTSEYRAGDIDVFFTKEENAKAFLENAKRVTASQAGFAKNLVTWLNSSDMNRNIQVQFVDHPMLCNGTIENALSRFDFMNCAIAFDKTHIWVPRGWHALEASKLIKINHNLSPFLGTRIAKYVKYRGYDGLTEESHRIFTEWLIKAVGNNFDAKMFGQAQKISNLESLVRRLSSYKLMTKEDLLFFIGKWRQTIQVGGTSKYGPTTTIEVDWAMNELPKARDEAHTSA